MALDMTFTPMQLIWTIVGVCVFVIMFTLYHMLLEKKHRKRR